VISRRGFLAACTAAPFAQTERRDATLRVLMIDAARLPE
jgi:hypothetical protein